MKIQINHTLSLEELAHIEKSLMAMRHCVQVTHQTACEEFKDCHPYMAMMLRDLITACIDQANSLLSAQAVVNKAYRFILENATEHGDKQEARGEDEE